MKFVRYMKGSTEYRGVIEGDTVTRINGTIFHDYTITDDKMNVADIKILQPILPSKIVGFRKNYKINDDTPPTQPLLFLKPSTSVIGEGEDIIIPNDIDSIMIEGEIGIVIGKKGFNIPKERAGEYILGATIANDVTGHAKRLTDTVTESKFYNTFTPLGRFINTNIDYNNLKIQTFINDELVQSGVSSDMVFKVDELIAYSSRVMTLLPGDILLTGTPSKAIKANTGDTIIITIDSLDSLKNTVR